MAIIVGGMLLIGGLFSIYLYGKIHSVGSQGSASIPQSSTAPDLTKTNEGISNSQYNAMAVKKDQDLANAAQANNQSFVPTFAPASVDVAPKQQSDQSPSAMSQFGLPAAQPLHQGQNTDYTTPTQAQIQAQAQAQITPEQLAAQHDYEANQKLIDDTQAKILANKQKQVDALQTAQFSTEGYSSFTVASYAPKEDNKPGLNGSNAGSIGKPSCSTCSASAVSSKPFIKSGSRAFVSIDTAINTDEKSPVTGTILTGAAAGLTVFGKVTLNDDNTIAINFNQLNLSDGKSTVINAYAIDPSTGSTAVNGSVNHKIFQRFVLPAIAGAGSTVAQIEQQNGMQQQSSPLSGMMSTTYAPTGGQIADAAVGAGLGSLSTNLNNIAANAKPAVSTPRDLGLEIIFMKEVVITQPVVTTTN